jgi:hypothetical protein
MLGHRQQPGVVTHVGRYSSIIYLFILNEDITLMNDYVDKITMNNNDDKLKIGDLVELKPKIRKILSIKGAGTIINETVIKTNDFDGRWKDDAIDAFLVYFSEEDYEYTIPKSCLQLFSITKND